MPSDTKKSTNGKIWEELRKLRAERAALEPPKSNEEKKPESQVKKDIKQELKKLQAERTALTQKKADSDEASDQAKEAPVKKF